MRCKHLKYGCPSRRKQIGAALILIMFILGLGIAAYTIKAFTAASAQVRQDEGTKKTLGEAKAALIGWAVSNRYTPGEMPWPDRNLDGNFDGSSDCATTSFNHSLFIGQLPSRPATNPCYDPNTGLNIYAGFSTYPNLGQEFTDSSGNRLWYAVSRNLVRNHQASANPIINPGLINIDITKTSPYDGTSSTSAYPWLIVRNHNGLVISDRVAAVIIAPGSPLSGQSRSNTAPVSAYLDQLAIGATIYSNQDYDTDNEDFIMGATGGSTANSFNDQLVYITIDELMAALEKRVGEQVKASLVNYRNTYGYYPYAAQLGTTTNFSCEQTADGTDGLKNGMLPVDYSSCSVTTVGSGKNLSCNGKNIFDVTDAGVGITQVRFDSTPTSGILSSTTRSDTGDCDASGNTCTCTGIGSCTWVDTTLLLLIKQRNFACNSLASCRSDTSGTYKATGGKFTSATANCAHTTFPTKNATSRCYNETAVNAQNGDSVISCSDAGTFSSCADARFDNLLPSWFKTNRWQGYVYYHINRPPGPALTAGGQTPLNAVIITAGRPITSAPYASKGSAQVRPSCNALNNYLDSTENTNSNTTYDAVATRRSMNYNDQIFVIKP
jgi:hypothetical protein